MAQTWSTVDGNEAVAHVAHRVHDVIAIYPITPSSSMGELCDEWAAKGKTNLWGAVPRVVEMQSEAGAAGAVHGALQAGALATTFTASQGLLLMIPDMFKIAGELTPFCMHVAARTIATHALSIFGDHSDVMACRTTGFAMLASASVQEAHDMAMVAFMATLRSRVPFLHFFDGFRTSHEVAKVQLLGDDDLAALLPIEAIAAHKARALTPEAPVIRGTAQNPDTFFQAREACTPWYAAVADHVEAAMADFAARSGRHYAPFEYAGAPDAERVIVLMGSGAETVASTVRWMVARGEKVGVVRVRLYRPFDGARFVASLPRTVRRIAVLDRTKEPGAVGDPLYLDVLATLSERAANLGFAFPTVIAGRYGLSSKEFTPGMVVAVYDELGLPTPKNHFTLGIVDDVSGTSLDYDADLEIEPAEVQRAVFYGLGSDGTVGANKNSIKILGDQEGIYAQGYFVYDSKKSGTVTTSHLRFGPEPIHSPWLIRKADFVACHQYGFVDRLDIVEHARDGAVLLLNSPHGPEDAFDRLPVELQRSILHKRLRFYVIDAWKVARANGMGSRINTIMQTCWFAISGVLPREAAIASIKRSIEKSYARRGAEVVAKNHAAVDATLQSLHEVCLPAATTATRHREPPVVGRNIPDFVQRVTARMIAGEGDSLPVSAFPVDGTWPVGTARFEKRNLAQQIPIWDPAICIQCNKCAMVCPHAAIRVKVYDEAGLAGAPDGFRSVGAKGPEYAGKRYTVQVAPEDCTGCAVCVAVCPAKDKQNPRHKSIDMLPQAEHVDAERAAFAHFLQLPDPDRATLKVDVRSAQLLPPLFEFSGACSGCGETPYVKLLTQLVGDHLIIANATGCSSIYGGNLPTTPYCTDQDGRGPAWANSLFEDNAEFGLGMRVAVDQHAIDATLLVQRLAGRLGDELVGGLLAADQTSAAGIAAQRVRVAAVRTALRGDVSPDARRLDALADWLVRRSVWMVGGDGWAYDIGYGGLDHVLASGHDINVLVLDTEVYSNTGGQQSKATPLGATAKFAMAGKTTGKKDLGLMAMSYGNVYVARVAFGAKDAQTVKAFQEAESWKGPSLIIAYSHCIAHGYDLVHGLDQQKAAVDTGYWPLYRFDPRNVAEGQPALKLDSGAPKGDLSRFMLAETRFRANEQQHPEGFPEVVRRAEAELRARYALLTALATPPSAGGTS